MNRLTWPTRNSCIRLFVRPSVHPSIRRGCVLAVMVTKQQSEGPLSCVVLPKVLGRALERTVSACSSVSPDFAKSDSVCCSYVPGSLDHRLIRGRAVGLSGFPELGTGFLGCADVTHSPRFYGVRQQRSNTLCTGCYVGEPSTGLSPIVESLAGPHTICGSFSLPTWPAAPRPAPEPCSCCHR